MAKILIILSAVYSEEAAVYNIQQIMGQLLPTVTLNGSYDKSLVGEPQQRLGRKFGNHRSGQRPSLSGRRCCGANPPGQGSQQPAQERGRGRPTAGSMPTSYPNWGILQSSGPAIEFAQAAVSANKIALTGVREEEKVGQRTTLDVLDAQRELLNSQICLSARCTTASSPNIHSMRRLAEWTRKRLACQCLTTIRSSTTTS